MEGVTACGVCGRPLVAAPAAPAPAPARPRPVAVTVVAVLAFLVAGVGAVGTLLALLVFTALAGVLGLAFAAGIGCLAFLAGAVGWGLLRGQAWARIAMIGVDVIWGLVSLTALPQEPFGSVPSLVLAAFVLWALLTREARAYFGRA